MTEYCFLTVLFCIQLNVISITFGSQRHHNMVVFTSNQVILLFASLVLQHRVVMDFEDTLQTVGSFGIYQKRLTVIACCCQILVAFHTLSGVYIAYTPEHWCQTPDVHPNTTCTAKQVRIV